MRFALLLLFACQIALAQSGTKLTVNVSGVDSDKGQLVVSVWPGEQSWKDKEPLCRDAVELVDGGGVWARENLPEGDYAVTVYHDKNSNKKMDRHWYGPPKEKGAASNDAKAQTFGPPTMTRVPFWRMVAPS